MMLDQDASPPAIAELDAQYGFDQPLAVQYVRRLSETLWGDLSRSSSGAGAGLRHVATDCAVAHGPGVGSTRGGFRRGGACGRRVAALDNAPPCLAKHPASRGIAIRSQCIVRDFHHGQSKFSRAGQPGADRGLGRHGACWV